MNEQLKVIALENRQIEQMSIKKGGIYTVTRQDSNHYFVKSKSQSLITPFPKNCFEICTEANAANKCKICLESIEDNFQSPGEKFFKIHNACLGCSGCSVKLTLKPFLLRNGKVYCFSCYENSERNCSICLKALEGQKCQQINGVRIHEDCVGSVCDKVFVKDDFKMDGDKVGHNECFEQMNQNKTVNKTPVQKTHKTMNKTVNKTPVQKTMNQLKNQTNTQKTTNQNPPKTVNKTFKVKVKENNKGEKPISKERKVYSYEFLTNRTSKLPDDVDKKNLEESLSDKEFKEVFNMDLEAFKSLPTWQRNVLKKNKKLF